MEYVYTFNCPYTDHVVYVGKTLNPKLRLYQHLRSNYPIGYWLRAMKSLGHDPIMKIIEQVNGSASSIERKYIKHYASLNQAQHNTHGKESFSTITINWAIGIPKADSWPPLVAEKKKRIENISRWMSYGSYHFTLSNFALSEIERLLLTAKNETRTIAVDFTRQVNYPSN